MSNVLNARLTLRLNANWMRIGWSTVADAIVAMCSGESETPPALALDIDFERDKDGNPDFEKMASANPTKWEDWISLPIREWDMSIKTVRLNIRVPTVIVCPNYTSMPLKERRPTKQAIRERDNNRCQYTGQELTNRTASLDHIRPRSLGGPDTWENLVLAHRDINSRKGNKLNHEAGLTLLKKPVAPRPIPLCELIKENKVPEHQFF